ncbi:hypothetical protein HMPREF1861_01871 [Corynebacterium kroppenstedtii]|nr:hypothetical protein HMPREF1861_01871 [Corynebacterium kroppenstedtii]
MSCCAQRLRHLIHVVFVHVVFATAGCALLRKSALETPVGISSGNLAF